MFVDEDVAAALEPFEHDGWIVQVIREVKSGKEATVYCCAPGARAIETGIQTALLAAKVYRPMSHRGFKNDAIYTTGRMHVVREGRALRATQAKSAFGRVVQMGTWIDQEWSTMRAMHEAGVDVPQPLARAERAILMPFLGDADATAPNLIEVELSRTDVEATVDRLLANIELMLDCDVVHGDLSPYNVLHWNGRPVIIDLPQAVDPRLNPAAQSLLTRDVENICRWAGKRGVQRDGTAIARDLWRRFRLGEIG